MITGEAVGAVTVLIMMTDSMASGITGTAIGIVADTVADGKFC